MVSSQDLIAAFNRHVGNEMEASMLYVSIAAYFDSEDLEQLAGFFYRQSEEERDHAMRFVKYVVDAGGRVEIPQLPAPPSEFADAAAAVEVALASEQKVTRQIYELVEVAQKDRDHIAQRFLDWFVNEQFEEVSSMNALLSVVRRAGEANLLQVEDYLARTGPPEGAAGAE
ncbi:MAG: ferritin [Acidobacteriota bacterium]|nr:ferritin [Acidobacteriota bacterium]MDH3522989.1 ferritin [Acidobacteriota bacterium]